MLTWQVCTTQLKHVNNLEKLCFMGCKHSDVLWLFTSVCVWVCVCVRLFIFVHVCVHSWQPQPIIVHHFVLALTAWRGRKSLNASEKPLTTVCVCVWCLITFSNHLQADRWRNRNICLSLVFLGNLKQPCVYRKLTWPRPWDNISQHRWFLFQFSDVWLFRLFWTPPDGMLTNFWG